MTTPLRIGICGLGTVGQAVVRLLREEQETLARRAPRPLEIAALGMRAPKTGFDPGAIPVHRDVLAVARDPAVDVVVELMGGTDDAKSLVELALAEGKAVVTANKALLSDHGDALFAAATLVGLMNGQVPFAHLISAVTGEKVHHFGWHLNAFIAIILTGVLMFGFAVIVERYILKHLVNQEPIILFMATIGLAFFMEGFSDLMWGSELKKLDVGIPKGIVESVDAATFDAALRARPRPNIPFPTFSETLASITSALLVMTIFK